MNFVFGHHKRKEKIAKKMITKNVKKHGMHKWSRKRPLPKANIDATPSLRVRKRERERERRRRKGKGRGKRLHWPFKSQRNSQLQTPKIQPTPMRLPCLALPCIQPFASNILLTILVDLSPPPLPHSFIVHFSPLFPPPLSNPKSLMYDHAVYMALSLCPKGGKAIFHPFHIWSCASGWRAPVPFWSKENNPVFSRKDRPKFRN